jgi:hypothetical protein
MGLIREPLEVDFEFESQPLTVEEKKKISSYIKEFKAKNSEKKNRIIRRLKNAKPRKKVVAS